jgi:hypothetical protein
MILAEPALSAVLLVFELDRILPAIFCLFPGLIFSS